MDLTIPIENYILNVRVLVLVQSGDNYIFEKHKNGYFFGVGGRIKIGESSQAAALREISEELGITVNPLKYKAVIENFYDNVHEICFVYTCENVGEVKIDDNLFILFKEADIMSKDIRPQILKSIILDKSGEVGNYVVMP